MNVARTSQIRYLFLIFAAWMGIFFLTRAVLLAASLSEAEAAVMDIVRLYAVGAIYDAGFLVYALIPAMLYVSLCPARLWIRPWHRRALFVLFGSSLFVMLFTAVAEGLFWNEFGTRFNFIAVDYLIYSKEVVRNILESYPVYPILGGIALLSMLIAACARRRICDALAAPALPWRRRGLALAGLGVLAVLTGFVLDQDFPRPRDGNVYQRELASNGPYQFFAAFRNNELDFRQLYADLPDDEAIDLLRGEIDEANARFIGNDPEDIRRSIVSPGSPNRMNVVLVIIESLSAKYLGSFGDTRGLTPNLDALRRQSLFFSNFYATGTRTDRGLEAITLSIPPTPGRSIVKRIGRESGFASLGQQMKAQGYDAVFVYGGRGYFDNMNAFFGGNGYRIVDQSSVPAAEMEFTNAWGMSDEDTYRQVLKVADADYATGAPFFIQALTTSNHRPYTYPEGRIDIPSGDGREGAVKYSDHAIGRFLDQARAKPWFSRTVFVFVADHTGGSAGKEDLTVANYRIPLFIYAPGFVQPSEIPRVASQVDLAPTLLGLLNFDYTSTFFGRDILRDDTAQERALIGNYQHLGLFDGKNLSVLSPKKVVRRYDDALQAGQEVPANANDLLLRRNIAYYHVASHAYRKGMLAWRS
ncbi:MAG: LTA synthase family protein [Candidatus Accumulibacter sp.]|nr:LTA synthase family protein [Accumulibacter sp.]